MNDQNRIINNRGTPGAQPNGVSTAEKLADHPVGTGLGAIGAGAAAGAAGGAIAGPIGAVAGAVVGAVAGGLAGSALAEAVNPTVETKYWRESYAGRPYVNPALGFDEYAPAYRYGWESYGRRGGPDKSFDSVQADLQRGWDQARGTSRLAWDQAQAATRDAWDRLARATLSAPNRRAD